MASNDEIARAREIREQQSSAEYAAAWTTTPADYDIRGGDPAGQDRVCRAVYVGTTGTIVATNLQGTDITFTGVPAGAILPIQATDLKSGSTAQNVVVLW